MTVISTLIFGESSFEKQVLKALGEPEVLFPKHKHRANGRLELMVASEKLDGHYFVDAESVFAKVVVLYKLEPVNHVFPSGKILDAGWHPTGETLNLAL